MHLETKEPGGEEEKPIDEIPHELQPIAKAVADVLGTESDDLTLSLGAREKHQAVLEAAALFSRGKEESDVDQP